MTSRPTGPEASAERALDYVEKGQVIGLGTGRAAFAFVRALGARVRDGLEITGVPTSESTAKLARELGIPLLTLEEAQTLDTTFDGADEVDPQLDLIKGYGGALVREKIVAASSKRLVILVGREKLVSALGTNGVLPVEIVPFGLALCRQRLRALGCEPELRAEQDRPFVSDNGNFILDCKVSPIERPDALEAAIQEIPGVVGTGLFIGMAHAVIVGDDDRVEVHERGNP